MKLEGIITAMATPIDSNECVSEEGVESLVEHLISGGVSGLFILGTNGEFYSMTDDAKVEYVELVVRIVDGRVPVYAGTGDIGTNKVIELTKRMKNVGVSAVSIITPFMISLSQEEIYQHYVQISEQVELPIILYNIPSNTKLNIEPVTVGRLAKISNIIGIKDSSGDLDNLKGYLDQTKNEEFSVLVGSDSKILEALKLGASGAVAATSNVLTKTDVGIYNEFFVGNLDKAQELQESLEEYRRILKFGTVPSVLKYTLREIGIPVGYPLAPVRELLSLNQKQEINNVLDCYRKIEGF